MRKEQPPQRLNSEQTAFEDGSIQVCAKGNGLPPLPKTLNHYFSETTHFSSQHTAESSSEVSSGVSTDRTTSSQAGQISSNGGNQYNVTNSSRGSSKLFKGVSLCPPIAPKTMISPNLDKQGNHHGHSGSGGAVEMSTGSSHKQFSNQHKRHGSMVQMEDGNGGQPKATKLFAYFCGSSLSNKQIAGSVSPVKRLQASPEATNKVKRLNKAMKGSFVSTLSCQALEGLKASPVPIKSSFQSPVKLSQQ